MTVSSKLPPGPRQPAALQTIGWWARPVAFVERLRARYGKRFTIRLLASPPFVILSEPDQLKELFATPPDVLHPGEGAGILEPVVGQKSLILLDEHESPEYDGILGRHAPVFLENGSLRFMALKDNQIIQVTTKP